MAGRPRPSYVEMPTDLVGAPFSGETPRVEMPGRVPPDPDSTSPRGLLVAARRILIMPGAAVQRAGASAELRELAIRLDAPVAMAVTGAG